MDCAICLEDNLLEKNMHYMECLHYVCSNCFEKLLTDTCPFCREKIYLIPRCSHSIDYENIENDDDFTLPNYRGEEDFIVPTRRLDRQEYRRKKKLRKRERLENMLNDMLNKTNNIMFPNTRIRFGRKIRSY